MPKVGAPVRIEDLQATSKSPSIVVTVKPGHEQTAAALAQLSGADSMPFKVGADNLYLAGRGLNLKGVREKGAVVYKGQTGEVNGKPLNVRNTFKEGFNSPAARATTVGTTAVGLAVGAVVAVAAQLGSILLPGMAVVPWHALALFGAAGMGAGLVVSTLYGVNAARKEVDLKTLVTISK